MRCAYLSKSCNYSGSGNLISSQKEGVYPRCPAKPAPWFSVIPPAKVPSIGMDIDNVDFTKEPFDCAILPGNGHFGVGTRGLHLFDEWSLPLCAPDLLERRAIICRPASLSLLTRPTGLTAMGDMALRLAIFCSSRPRWINTFSPHRSHWRSVLARVFTWCDLLIRHGKTILISLPVFYRKYTTLYIL